MLAIIILVCLLVLFLILPVGVDLRYREGTTGLKLKLGPLGIAVLPKKKPGGEKPKKPKKPKKKKKKPPAPSGGEGQSKPRRKPALRDYLELASILLRAASRLRRHISVDVLRLRYVTAAPDPCDAIVRYGALNAAVSALTPLLHRIFKIRDEELILDLDVMADRPVLDARLVVTLQIWEIIYIGCTAAFGALGWLIRFRRASKDKEKQPASAQMRKDRMSWKTATPTPTSEK